MFINGMYGIPSSVRVISCSGAPVLSNKANGLDATKYFENYGSAISFPCKSRACKNLTSMEKLPDSFQVALEIHSVSLLRIYGQHPVPFASYLPQASDRDVTNKLESLLDFCKKYEPNKASILLSNYLSQLETPSSKASSIWDNVESPEKHIELLYELSNCMIDNFYKAKTLKIKMNEDEFVIALHNVLAIMGKLTLRLPETKPEDNQIKDYIIDVNSFTSWSDNSAITLSNSSQLKTISSLRKKNMTAPVMKGMTDMRRPFIAIKVNCNLTKENISNIAGTFEDTRRHYTKNPKLEQILVLYQGQPLQPLMWDQLGRGGSFETPQFFTWNFTYEDDGDVTKSQENNFKSVQTLLRDGEASDLRGLKWYIPSDQT